MANAFRKFFEIYGKDLIPFYGIRRIRNNLLEYQRVNVDAMRSVLGADNFSRMPTGRRPYTSAEYSLLVAYHAATLMPVAAGLVVGVPKLIEKLF